MKAKSILVVLAAAINLAIANDHDHGPGASGHDDDAATLGKPGDRGKISRTIEIQMSDAMRYTPANIAVKQGETIKLVIRNIGKVKHELVLGTLNELKEHAALMQKFPEMEHDEPNQVSVEPGKTGEIVWEFGAAGIFNFACLQPGHFEAGMVGKVAVNR
jgi:uncharacterized cupredoxin-like copper-binding protein